MVEGGGDCVAFAGMEAGIPGVVKVWIVGLGLAFEDGDGWREGAAVVGGFLVDPVAAVGAVAVEEVNVTVRHFDELAVGAERRDVVENLPFGDVLRFGGDDVGLPASSRGAEPVFAMDE